jgi:hypothetical protein
MTWILAKGIMTPELTTNQHGFSRHCEDSLQEFALLQPAYGAHNLWLVVPKLGEINTCLKSQTEKNH